MGDIEYYNLEIFDRNYTIIPYMDNVHFKVSFDTFIENCKSNSDKITIQKILNGLSDEERWHPQFIVEMFVDLYNDFIDREGEGKGRLWVNHTIDIVYNLKHDDLISWLDFTLERLKNIEVPLIFKMMKNPQRLLEICNHLENDGLIKDSAWKGVESVKSTKDNVERSLASLMFVMKEKDFFNNEYTAKEYHKAFTSYFRIVTGGQSFKKSQRYHSEKFDYLFKFI
jgi:hypothetical protein